MNCESIVVNKPSLLVQSLIGGMVALLVFALSACGQTTKPTSPEAHTALSPQAVETKLLVMAKGMTPSD